MTDSRPTLTRYQGEWWLTDSDNGYKRKLTREEFHHLVADAMEEWGLSLRVLGSVAFPKPNSE